METTEILNEIEMENVMKFAENKVMFESVKKYILAYLYQHGVTRPGEKVQGNVNWALQLAWGRDASVTDEVLGADLRAIARGIQVIESGFKELSEIKQPEVVKDEENKAI